MAVLKQAVAYARFSSEGQREESIDAQIRAIKDFASKNSYVLTKIYADRGISGTTDNRIEFQRMVDDAKSGSFDAVIVHKLDRFARNRTDSAIYRRELEKHGVRLLSVLENFDDSPESIILQSVIEGYNEYYSRNLRREVMKGLKENALSCRFTGGVPCLGYDIDKSTQRYVINSFEAEAVKLIFHLYLRGEGYSSIIEELNRRGFKTKRGLSFGKNSLYEILRNEKYTGVYLYNRSVHPDANGCFNRHAKKSDGDIIRIEGGIPQIISKEDFDMVQAKMSKRKHATGTFKAKHEYLLSGKIICGECGSTYAGNARRADKKNPLYISYSCTKKNGRVNCHNPGIKRDELEEVVLNRLSEKVFNKDVLPKILEGYNEFQLTKNSEYVLMVNELEAKISETDKGIANIVDLVVSTGSSALTAKLKDLEATKTQLESALLDAQRQLSEMSISKEKLKKAFNKAKQMLKSGTLQNRKAIVQAYVKSVTIFTDRIVIEYNISGTYTVTEEIQRN